MSVARVEVAYRCDTPGTLYALAEVRGGAYAEALRDRVLLDPLAAGARCHVCPADDYPGLGGRWLVTVEAAPDSHAARLGDRLYSLLTDGLGRLEGEGLRIEARVSSAVLAGEG